jgi:TrmH family RNA methyltransferase
VQYIRSRQNKTAKEIILLRDKKYRRRLRCFSVEGFRAVREALHSGMTVEKICFSSDMTDKVYQVLGDHLTSDICLFEAAPELFRYLAETESPQGILAVVRIPDWRLEDLYRNGFRGLILDNVQDPGNAGTIIRSAHALGFDSVVSTHGSVDIYNSKVLRATMGSIFYIPVIDNVDEKDIFSFCKEHNLSLIASDLKDAMPCYDADLSGEFFLIIGNEGKGISDVMRQNATNTVYIPMPGGAESFNAAIAASIIMYESSRQRVVQA